jgi:NADPH-dependent 2,4-dienoyl-CoA reductase/sulfur reductase-like enzyme/nitrite reductase/ring-hydroxylating ferredoxin subunit
MAEQATLTGPDLSAGVDASRLGAGESLLGHANGEPVLLVRLERDFVAVSAKCTHYSGPLAKGVIDGETVRCPWHHACFNLRTGEALRAPALDPLACWQVTRRGDRVIVTDKVKREPLEATYPATTDRARWPQRVVVVGAGAAGSAAIEMLQRCGYDRQLTLVDDDADAPYDRPNLSKDYLAGQAQEDWIPLRAAGFYEEHGVSIQRDRVERLDPGSKTLTLANGGTLRYDAVLLATGAEPVRLDLPGADRPHVRYLRSLADSRAIVHAAEHAKQAVVIGASFIGLEVAASLRTRNIDVHVVGREDVPLGRILGDHLGTSIRKLHEERGVVFHLGRSPREIVDDSVILDDGTRVAADLVVIGVGVNPRLALAEQAGLKVDKGVVVSEYLETTAPGVFAAGDIAKWPDPRTGELIRVEHWVVAQRQGQTAARNILGARERFDAVPFFWSAHYDVSINYVGHATASDRAEVDGDAANQDVAVRFVSDGGDGKVHALATLFRDEESLRGEIEMESRASSVGRQVPNRA